MLRLVSTLHGSWYFEGSDKSADEDSTKIPDVSIVEASAELLYGLVHQRFIITRAGLQAMVSTGRSPLFFIHHGFTVTNYVQADKYEAGMFGSCPRVYCQGCNVVPCGRSDIPGMDTVKLFCPNCCDIYTPPSSRFQGVDGARPSLAFCITYPLTLLCTGTSQARSSAQHSHTSSSTRTASLRPRRSGRGALLRVPPHARRALVRAQARNSRRS
jgi:hypothetical protein